MIFHFPNLETLRVALTSGQVPPAVSLEPAEFSFDAEGRPSVKPHGTPPKTMQNALKRLGVKTGNSHLAEPRHASSWPEIIPLLRESSTPNLAPTVPVLFEMPAPLMATVVTEMLRLGNDRQSFRMVGDDVVQRVLLRVIGPPFYTLLRALDHLDADITAFLERAPRVWVELGYSHPLAASLKAPEGRILLLRSPDRWSTIEDGPFYDIYGILDFKLPNAAVDFSEGKLQGKLSVPLRLAPGNAAELPEMWVVRDNAVAVFDQFVHDADERLMGRLMFAVAENTERGPAVILRTRPSKLPPPAIELEGAVGYLPFRRMNNLFLPAGTRLQPTLRRDVVRKMLADDPGQVVWLAPLGEGLSDGRFTPETIPEEAFLPLQDWIEYVIDHDRQALQAWMQATQFDFESFICKEEKGEPTDEPPRPPPTGKKKPRRPGERAKGASPDESPAPPLTNKFDADSQSEAANEKNSAAAGAAPDQWKIQRSELERAFLAVDGPLEAPERLAYWPKLAVVNGLLRDHAEASICWLNGLWECAELPEEWLQHWLKAEEKESRLELTKADLDRELAIATPSQSDMRRLAVKLLLACIRRPLPAALGERLAAVRSHLEKNEDSLGIRAVWLVWLHLSKASGDVLGLARVRDRLAMRLLGGGLHPESDVPRFIRLSGTQDTDRMREIIERAHRIHAAARKWATLESAGETAANGAYIDLMFAFGFASLGEIKASRDRLAAAEAVIANSRDSAGMEDQAHALLLEGFRYRIEQAAAGKPHRGPLPAEWRERLSRFKVRVGSLNNDPRKIGPYLVERFQEQSWVLEPEEKLNPYRIQTQSVDDLNREIAALPNQNDKEKLAAQIKKLMLDRHAKISPEMRVAVARDVLPFCPRIGGDFTRRALEQVIPIIAATTDTAGQPIGGSVHLPENQGKLLERALLLAVNYEMPELVKRFTEQIEQMFKIKDDESLYKVIDLTATRCLRSLRRLGLRDEIHQLLIKMDSVLKERAPKAKTLAMKGRVDVLSARLQVAGAWIYFGGLEKSLGTIDEVRDFLFTNSPTRSDRPWHADYARLAKTYISAVGNAPIDFTLDRIEELLIKLAKVPNTYTTRSHFSRLHLNVIEEVILTVMQLEAALGETARRWLDDDEYLVRRRIHADMRNLLSQSGL